PGSLSREIPATGLDDEAEGNERSRPTPAPPLIVDVQPPRRAQGPGDGAQGGRILLGHEPVGSVDEDMTGERRGGLREDLLPRRGEFGREAEVCCRCGADEHRIHFVPGQPRNGELQSPRSLIPPPGPDWVRTGT